MSAVVGSIMVVGVLTCCTKGVDTVNDTTVGFSLSHTHTHSLLLFQIGLV